MLCGTKKILGVHLDLECATVSECINNRSFKSINDIKKNSLNEDASDITDFLNSISNDVMSLKQYQSHIFQIAIPDPVAKYILISLDDVPKNDKAIHSLIQWHFKNELHLQSNEFVFTYQLLAQDKQNIRLYACALAKSVHVQLIGFAQNTSQTVDVIDVNHRYLNNYFKTTEHQRDICLYVMSNYWTIVLNDQYGQPLYIRSKWRDQIDYNIDGMLKEVSRILRSKSGLIDQENGGMLIYVADNQDIDNIEAYSNTLQSMQITCLTVGDDDKTLTPAEIVSRRQ